MRMPCTFCISVEPIEQCLRWPIEQCLRQWRAEQWRGTAARGFLVLPYSTVDRLSRGRGSDSSRTPRSEPRPGPPAAVAAFYAPPPPLPLRRSGSRSRAPSPPSRISRLAVARSRPWRGRLPRKCTSRTRVCVNVMRSTRKHTTPTQLPLDPASRFLPISHLVSITLERPTVSSRSARWWCARGSEEPSTRDRVASG